MSVRESCVGCSCAFAAFGVAVVLALSKRAGRRTTPAGKPPAMRWYTDDTTRQRHAQHTRGSALSDAPPAHHDSRVWRYQLRVLPFRPSSRRPPNNATAVASWTRCAPRGAPSCWTRRRGQLSQREDSDPVHGDVCTERSANLSSALALCAQTPWCDGVTSDRGVPCGDRTRLFARGGVHLSDVCVQDGELLRHSQPASRLVQLNAGDYGGSRRYVVTETTENLAAASESEPFAIVAWFSCEGNINHLVGETLAPMWQQLQLQHHADPPRLVIVGPNQWPTADHECHSERFAFVASLLRIHPHVLFARASGRSRSCCAGAAARQTTAYDLGERRALPAPQPRTCFRTTVQVTPSYNSGAGSQGLYAQLASAANCSRPRALEAVVVRRNASRRILNLRELLAALRALPHVAAARAIDLATLDAAAQLRTMCAHRLLIGVHGQGLEWGHMLNAGQPRGAGLIEFRAGSLGCYYAERMARSGLAERTECQKHAAVGGHRIFAPKAVDVQVDLHRFTAGASRIISRMVAGDVRQRV